MYYLIYERLSRVFNASNMDFIHLKYAFIVARSATVSEVLKVKISDLFSLLRIVWERSVGGVFVSGSKASKIVSKCLDEGILKRTVALVFIGLFLVLRICLCVISVFFLYVLGLYCCFLRNASFGCSFCCCSKLCNSGVCSSSKCESAFSAFPDSNTYSTDSWKHTFGAFVRFLHFSDCLYVTFSDCGSITRT